MTVEYQTRASECPRCGSSADVRTARDLFDTLNTAPGQGFPRPSQPFGSPGPGSGQDQGLSQDQASGPGQPWNSGQGQDAGQAQSAAPGQGRDWNSGPGQGAGQGQDQNSGASPAPDSSQGQGPGQPQGPSQGPAWNYPSNDDYDHYNVESSDPVTRSRNQATQARRDFDIFHPVDSIADDIGGAVAGAAVGFLGRRLKKAFEEKVMPAVQAKMAQAQQQAGRQADEREAIAARYPDLRVCTADQLIFLHGQYQTIPVSELTAPLTLAQADAVVARLR